MQCSKCKLYEPEVSFYKTVRSYCRKCFIAYQQERKLANKDIESYLKLVLKNAKANAKAKNLDFNLSISLLLEMWAKQKGLCALTGYTLLTQVGERGRNPYVASLDRKDYRKGYVEDNVRFLCWWANNAKMQLDDETFLKLCTNVKNA